MSELKIRGINVKFPYEKPYDIQETYMSKVMDCLEDKKHGVLESPTGTGKTLCLFAPVTSWLQHQRRSRQVSMEQISVPNDNLKKSNVSELIDRINLQRTKKQKVWYTARTHAQIAQTISEVRRCDIEGLSIRVLGARDQLCVHPEVMQEKEFFIKATKCKERVKNKSCTYHKRLDVEVHSQAIYQPGEVLDIEDLVTAGKTHHICPYFLARSAREKADVILMPYNYIIDREIRGDVTDFKDDIIIFDEGHNVPNTCEENYEFSFSSVDMANGIRSVQDLMEGIARMSEFEAGDEDSLDLALHGENSMKLMEALKGMESQLAALRESPQLYPLTDLLKLFEKSNITQETSEMYVNIIESFKNDNEKLQLNGNFLTTLHLLENAIQTLYGPAIRYFDKDLLDKSFKFSVSQDTDNSTVKNSKKLSLFCFNPSFGIKEVLMLQVQSMIITSGTLSPLKNFIYEMGIEDPVTLENRHIATKAQVPFMILGTGVNNVQMDSSFKNRDNAAYKYSLGMTLTNLILSVPDGVLLLFSSYSIMQNLKNYWETETGVWKRLTSIKRVFIEPKGKDDFISCMENYRRAIDAGNGAVLMGVLRGKISEGMDFKDQYCRCVFVVGVPFPPVRDPRVVGKGNYCNSFMVKNPRTNVLEKLYGSAFIYVEAMKTTNQAIGRVIRHGNDYGAIILVDYRFTMPNLYHHISRWMRDEKSSQVNFPIAKKTLREFFKNVHNGNLSVPEIRSQPVNHNGEPIINDAKYDVYDHKRMRCAPAPWIDASTSQSQYKKQKISYDDDSPPRNEDLLSIYKNCTPSTSQQKGESSQESFLDALGSSDGNTLVQYREVNLSAVCANLEKQEQKPSPSLLATQPYQKRRSRMKLIDLTAEEPEAEEDVTDRKKDDVKSYVLKIQSELEDDDDKNVFKDAVVKYMTKQLTLNESLKIIVPLLKKHEFFYENFMGFRCCVRFKDVNAWKGLQRKYLR